MRASTIGAGSVGAARLLWALFDMETIGFDARISRCALEALWPAKRREQYLINPACRYPLSVDFISWPSLFNNEQIGIGLTREHKAELGFSEVTIPVSLGEHHPFWDDLVALLQNRPAEGEILKVKRLRNDSGQGAECTDAAWEFQGFDAADEGFNSAMTNTFCPSFTKSWKENWAPKLNENGLFAHIEDAIAFISSVAELKSQIMPLMPYGLYINPALSSSKRPRAKNPAVQIC